MYILGLDLETTSLDIATCEVIEVGACLWDVERKRAVTLMDDLVITGHPIPPEITELTGIETEYLLMVGEEPGWVAREYLHLYSKAQAVVAHGGINFDRPILDRFLEVQFSIGRLLRPEPIPWIDTTIDLPFPPETTSRKLRHLASDHGFLHDEFAHRAVFDVISMLRIASNYDIPSIIEQAKSPMVTIQAVVSYEDRNLAKEKGFTWEPTYKRWIKNLRECNVLKDYGFPVRVIS